MIPREFARYVVIGALAALFNTLVIVALTEWLGLHYLVSYFLCFMIVTGLAFALNRSWTFQMTGSDYRAEGVRYFLLSFCALCIAMLATWTGVRLGMPYYVATLCAAVAMTPVNYLLHRVVSFGLGKPWA